MVLIIDDEADVRDLILEVLREGGIAARAAGPGEALYALHHYVPDVVLLDVSMPGLDGYSILQYVRSEPRLSRCFVLMVTARAALSDLTAGLDGGADDYLTKPFAVDELLARVRLGLKSVARPGGACRECA